jgi:hypothetical protein
MAGVWSGLFAIDLGEFHFDGGQAHAGLAHLLGCQPIHASVRRQPRIWRGYDYVAAPSNRCTWLAENGLPAWVT